MDSNTQTQLESVAWLQEDLKRAGLKHYAVEKAVMAVLAVSLILLSFFVYWLADYLVRFPRTIRILLTAGFVAGACFLVRRLVFQSVKRLGSEENVARLVETVKDRAGESLRSLLICALQFNNRPEISGSVDLKNETIRLARERCAHPSLVPIHNKHYARRAMQSATVALAIYISWMSLGLPVVKVFIKRVAGLNAVYPTTTKVVEQNWKAVAPIRVDYPVEIIAAGRLPSAGQLTVAFNGEKSFQVKLAQDEEKPSRYHAVITCPLKSFKFTVKLGDYESEKNSVTVAIPAFVSAGSVEIKPPAYTGLTPSRGGLENLNVLEGSDLVFHIKPNRAIRECTLLPANEEPRKMKQEGDDYILAYAATQTVTCSLRLVDNDGLENVEKATFMLNVKPDQTPKVEIILPRSGASRSNLSRIGFEVSAKDDYGIGSTRIVYKTYRVEHKDEQNTEKVVKEGEFPLNPAGGGSTVTIKLDKLTQDFNAAEGDRIALTAVALDNFPGTPHKGSSDEISVFIVTPSELRTIIGREQKRLADLVRKVRDEERQQAEAIQKRLGGG